MLVCCAGSGGFGGRRRVRHSACALEARESRRRAPGAFSSKSVRLQFIASPTRLRAGVAQVEERRSPRADAERLEGERRVGGWVAGQEGGSRRVALPLPTRHRCSRVRPWVEAPVRARASARARRAWGCACVCVRWVRMGEWQGGRWAGGGAGGERWRAGGGRRVGSGGPIWRARRTKTRPPTASGSAA